MPIGTTYPHCRAVYNLTDHLRGKTVRCKKCQGVIVIHEVAATIVKEKAKSPTPAPKGSVARQKGGSKVGWPKRNLRAEEAKTSPRRQRSRESNLGLVIGLFLGGVMLLFVGGGGPNRRIKETGPLLLASFIRLTNKYRRRAESLPGRYNPAFHLRAGNYKLGL